MRKEKWDEYHQKTNSWITGERVVYVCPISSLAYSKHVENTYCILRMVL